MKSQSIDNPMKLFVKLIERYNFVIFIVLVSVGLSVSILTLNDILNRPYANTNNSGGSSSTIFDQSTIKLLDKLETSTNNNTYTTKPSGRVNPFSE